MWFIHACNDLVDMDKNSTSPFVLLRVCVCFCVCVQLSKPQKVCIPERYIDSEPEEPLSPQELEERHRKVERIKSILAKSRYRAAPPQEQYWEHVYVCVCVFVYLTPNTSLVCT